MDQPLRVYGYHGTSGENAKAILTGNFKISHHKYDWLGDGAYFWQDAPMRAWQWAQERYGEDPAVVMALIRLERQYCIDLLDIEWMDELKALVPGFLARFQEKVLRQQGKAHGRDREFFNFVVGGLKVTRDLEIKALRAAFVEGEPLMEGVPPAPGHLGLEESAIYDLSHVQVAVRDVSIIEDMRRLDSPN